MKMLQALFPPPRQAVRDAEREAEVQAREREKQCRRHQDASKRLVSQFEAVVKALQEYRRD